MFAFARPGFWALFFTEFKCHHCGSREGYVSRPRDFLETYVLSVVALRPARCGECYRRTWRPVRVPLLPRMESMNFDPEQMVASAQAADHKEAQEETRVRPPDRHRIA